MTRAATAACAAILCISTVFAPVHAGAIAEEEADIIVSDPPEVSHYMDVSDASDISDAPEIADEPAMPDCSDAAEVPEVLRAAEHGETMETAGDLTDVDDSVEVGLSEIPDAENDAEGSDLPEVLTGAGESTWVVGDNVTAEISSKNLCFSSDSGQLYYEWKEIIGDSVLSVESVSVSGKMYLPEDSSFFFEDMTMLKSINTAGMDTSRVTDMAGMFAELSALTQLDLSGFATSNVGDMSSMFSGCGNLAELNLANFDTTKAATDDMFLGCSKLAKLVTPKVNSSSVKLPKTMYDKSGKSYTALPNLTSSITLTASKPAVTPTPVPTKYAFSDVQNPKHAYFNAIYWAADAGITKGYPDGTFGINRSCTRGECMMFLWRLKGKPAPKTVAKSPFTDVPKNHVFYNAILWGAQKKITTGYTSGEKKGMFDIDANCSRGQIVTFLYRAK